MSKVLLPTIDYTPRIGGVARYLEAIKQTFPDAVDVLYWEVAPGRLSMLRQLISRGRKYEQIWVSHILPIGTMAWLAKLFTGTPYVVFLHGMDFDLARRTIWKRWLTKRILRGAKRVVANTQALAAEAHAFADIHVPMVVYPTLTDDIVAREPQLPPSGEARRMRLLTVSRLVERKGHIDVIDAISSIPEVDYWIIGDGEAREHLEQYVRLRKMQDRVKFFGTVTDEGLARCYAETDIFVMPTRKTSLDREGFGIVYLEAQLFCLPVIASNHSGVDEAVSDGETGILVNDNDELKAAIRVFVDYKGIRKRMGDGGKERVSKMFTREEQVSKLKELLD